MRKCWLVLLIFALVVCFPEFVNGAKVKKVIEVEEPDIPYTGMKLAGKLGFGYSNCGTPLGLKYWLSDTIALDAGFGFSTADNVQNFGTQVGFNLVLVSTEPVLLEFRGSMGFDTGVTTNLNWMPVVAVEYFVTKNVSLNLGVGLLFYLQVSPAASFTFSHTTGTTGSLGFYYYF